MEDVWPPTEYLGSMCGGQAENGGYNSAMEDHRWIDVSPRHSIRLASELLQLIDRPQQWDFTVHTIEKRIVNGAPLMSAEIVIAGSNTREQFPLAAKYPLHFRKTYFAARLHADPAVEYENTLEASLLLDMPEPIGHSSATFRSCLIPGAPYKRLTPFHSEADDGNLRQAADLPLAAAAGLWRLAEEAFARLSKLHEGGLAHGDAELQNYVVCPAPLEVLMIDFEVVVRRDRVDADAWQKRCALDRVPLLREAIFLQAAMGRQRGPLADLSWQAAPGLFRDADRFRRAMDRLGDLST